MRQLSNLLIENLQTKEMVKARNYTAIRVEYRIFFWGGWEGWGEYNFDMEHFHAMHSSPRESQN